MSTRQLLSGFLWLSAFVIASCSAGAGPGSTGAGGSGGGGRSAGGLYSYGGLSSSSGMSRGPSGGGGVGGSSGHIPPSRYYMPVGLGNPDDPTRYRSASSASSSDATGGRYSGPSAKDAASVPRSNRISAWGIISIVMFVIMIGAGAYWGFICYPLLCKKERHYNIMMDMSSATTATPTRSTEFEKLENYCSKSTTSSRSNDTGISNI